jgi:hypothetical protein
MRGRTVKVFLVDGTPNGIVTAEIINWTGRIIVTPRSQLPDLAKRAEVKKTGVYILTGEDPERPTHTRVYVGESDNVWSRLKQHVQNPEKDFWQRTVIIISKDENLTKAHVRYLERRLLQIIAEAERANLSNGTSPTVPSLPEPDVADMEYFLEQVQILLPVLGFSFASPAPKVTSSSKEEPQDTQKNVQLSPVFHMNYAGVSAFAQEINNEFVVLKDSTVRKREVDSLAVYYIQMREDLLEEGKLVDSEDNEYWVLTQDVAFSSLSTAASVVAGASLNGRIHWKEKDTQKTYADWQEEQVEQADEDSDTVI